MKRVIQPQIRAAGVAVAPTGEEAFLQAVLGVIPGTFCVLDEQTNSARWNGAAR